MKGKRQNSKGRFCKRMVIFCIGAIIVYTVYSCITYALMGLEPSTLTTCVFAFFGGELMLCCLKRIFTDSPKKNTENKESENEDAVG